MMVVSAVWFVAPAPGGLTFGLAPLACTPTSGPLYSDFNADGYADVAIAIYSEDIGAEVDAGGANVIYGSAGGLQATGAGGPNDQFINQDFTGIDDTAEDNDNFGQSVAAGDFDGDDFADLAVGAWGEGGDTGVVHILYGGTGGLSASRGSAVEYFHQDRSDLTVGDGNQTGDRFGIALTAGDFNGNGFDDLAIGTDGEDTMGKTNVGAVYVMYGASGGLGTTGAQFWHQGVSGINGVLETGDALGRDVVAGHFNSDAFDDLAIGVELEDQSMTVLDSGAVNVLYGSSSGLTATGNVFFTQDTTDIAGDGAQQNDFFGRELAAGLFNSDTFDDLAIGAKAEDVNTTTDAGAVNVLFGSSSGLVAADSLYLHQDDGVLTGGLEQGDWLGRALAAGDFDDDGADELAIGVYREDDAGHTDAGALHVLQAGATPLSDEAFFWVKSDLGGSQATLDEMARGLDSADYNGDGCNDLMIGIRNQEVVGDGGTKTDAGAAITVYGSASGLDPTTSEPWNQGTSTDDVEDQAEDTDRFGWDFG